MKQLLPRLALGIGSLLVACPVTLAGDDKKKGDGPPPPQRGPEHKLLERLAGVYDAKVKVVFRPKEITESTAVMTRTMVLDGIYLQERFKGEFFQRPFRGLGMIGYDIHKKKYVTAWFDNFTTSMTLLEGTWDADKKTLTSVGEDTDPGTGKKMKARDVLTIISDDEQFFEMYRHAEGAPREFKVMEVRYQRRK
jgi:hypothetical protein